MSSLPELLEEQSLPELQEELEIRRGILQSIGQNPEYAQLRAECHDIISRIEEKFSVLQMRNNAATSSTPMNSRSLDVFDSPPLVSPNHGAIDLSYRTTMAHPVEGNMNPLVRKRSNIDLSPSNRGTKSRRTDTHSHTSDADDDFLLPNYDHGQKEQEGRLQREAADARVAQQMSQDWPPNFSAPVASSSRSARIPQHNSATGSSLPSQSYIKSEPTTNSVIRKEPDNGISGWDNAVVISSDDSELEEIEPTRFKSNNRKPSAQQSASRQAAYAPIDMTRNMDGSLTRTQPGFQVSGPRTPYPAYMALANMPGMNGAGGSSVYSYPGYPGYEPYGQQAASSAYPGLLPTVGNGLMSLANSFGSGVGSVASALSNAMQNPAAFGLGAEGDPLNPKMAELYSVIRDPSARNKDILDLLNHIQDDGEVNTLNRKGTPDGLKYPLYEYQKIALSWMIRSEESRNNKGGILADDMGLGKTITTLALLLARPPEGEGCKTTLIVGPVALVRQWQTEIHTKILHRVPMSTLLVHGNKTSYDNLRQYRVVLTTYGTLAAEHKKLLDFEAKLKLNPHMDQSHTSKTLPFLGPKSKFYRIILDEAQCIKNKATATAKACCLLKATYRWCLTGTPMMNNTGELYSLIKFLRIKPYDEWPRFRDEFGSLTKKDSDNHSFKHSLNKLRAVLKAILLRRTKKSLIDGKPILTLPDKIEEVQHVVFDEEEQAYYTSLETKQRLTFNKYCKAGTVSKQYIAILVLLLRLRQAACHPHLITDYEEAPSSADITVDEMVTLAKSLSPDVVQRLLAIEEFECPVCYDPVLNPRLVVPCGHDTCSECLVKICETGNVEGIAAGNENSNAKCPSCRGPVVVKKVIDYATFRKVYKPNPAEDADDEDTETDESDSDSDSDTANELDESDDGEDLKGFIVPDDLEDSEDEIEDEETEVKDEVKAENGAADSSDLEDILPAQPSSKGRGEKSASSKAKRTEKKKARKGKKKDIKGKGKAKEEDEAKSHLSLGKLRKESSKSRDHMKKYKRYLKKNYIPSAKITKCVELLKEALERDTKTIVFSQFTALLDLIEVPLDQEGIVYERYTGAMTGNARHDAVQKFTTSKTCNVFLVSLKAGNAGLNLTEASNVIIMDPFWNPYVEMQAVDRAHRIGQRKVVQVHRIIVKGTVEDRILELQETKRNLVESALDEGASKKLARLGHRELAYLFNGNQAPELDD